MTQPRDVCLVFDTTAVTSWVRGSLAVGETLAEIDDEGGAVLIPLWCLVQAGDQTGMVDRERLDLLLKHPATFLIVDDGEDWDSLVALQQMTGAHDRASAALMALHMDVDVMTSKPHWYASVKNGQKTLLIED
ncbi:hypothetical protein AMIS_20380 [Actinoplanes missouriensis 431]|uniref:PIN domain-containing protein n=1 Tax=Actinoplanes missouriensis (strain ATCC 14538 / DSM 43046 / CBS 188.64 / JCM 3121 / NBRC 102363 / NCIMB 12654 / NRRL B-3342 / UNCC 431) TaxID=512565 RepID=I0H2M1_ACTM4|nr:hypothetical protein [Actinoplanes missouriensis]BAL87258.1 hypothetical protein AMIS_20380 [Actinoplanes missouriensis 431]